MSIHVPERDTAPSITNIASFPVSIQSICMHTLVYIPASLLLVIMAETEPHADLVPLQDIRKFFAPTGGVKKEAQPDAVKKEAGV